MIAPSVPGSIVVTGWRERYARSILTVRLLSSPALGNNRTQTRFRRVLSHHPFSRRASDAKHRDEMAWKYKEQL